MWLSHIHPCHHLIGPCCCASSLCHALASLRLHVACAMGGVHLHGVCVGMHSVMCGVHLRGVHVGLCSCITHATCAMQVGWRSLEALALVLCVDCMGDERRWMVVSMRAASSLASAYSHPPWTHVSLG